MLTQFLHHFQILNFLLFALNNVQLSDTRIFKRCEFAKEMLRLETPKSELATWSCIVQFESKFNTSAVGQLNGNWSNDYGLFQVSDRYWCQSRANRTSANLCQVKCQSLISDNIAEAVKCAQYVKKRQGWRAWAAYNGRCNKLNSLTSIEECF